MCARARSQDRCDIHRTIAGWARRSSSSTAHRRRGKLTVGRELARLTGLRLFHNHLTNDLAHEIFPERNADFGDLVARLRLDVFEAAARAEVSLVSTYVYAAGPGD